MIVRVLDIHQSRLSQPKGPQQVIGILDINILCIFNWSHVGLSLLEHHHEPRQPQPQGPHHVPVYVCLDSQHGTVLKQSLIQSCT